MSGFAPIRGVDAGRLIQMFQAGQDRRIALDEMTRKRALEDAEMARKARYDGLLERAFNGGGAAPATGTLQGQYMPPPSVAAPAVNAQQEDLGNGFRGPPPYSTIEGEQSDLMRGGEAPQPVDGVGGPEAAPEPAPRQSMQLDPNIVRQMAVLDPEQTNKLVTTFSNLDEMGRKAYSHKYGIMGAVSNELLSADPRDRPRLLQQLVPALLQAGWTEREIQAAQLDDGWLKTHAALAMDVEKARTLAETARHNREGEAVQRGNLDVARGRLGVSQGALGLARQREGRVAAGKGGDGDNSDLNYLMGD